jgi:hypothetical protein
VLCVSHSERDLEMGGDASKNASMWEEVFKEDTKESAAVTKTVLGQASSKGQLTPLQLQELVRQSKQQQSRRQRTSSLC